MLDALSSLRQNNKEKKREDNWTQPNVDYDCSHLNPTAQHLNIKKKELVWLWRYLVPPHKQKMEIWSHK